MKKRYQVYGYTSKSGRQGNYKAIATFKKDGQDRVRLQSFGANPVEFWVDRDKLQEPFPIKAKPGAETRQCWECGCEFTWADAQNNGGDWGESYCGC